MALKPDRKPLPLLHLRILEEGLEAIGAERVRLLAVWDAAPSEPTSLDAPEDAGVSVFADKRPVSVNHEEARTCGRSP